MKELSASGGGGISQPFSRKNPKDFIKFFFKDLIEAHDQYN